MRYEVVFERIGRRQTVAPLAVDADTADEIAEAVFDYARPRLASKMFEVTVDLDRGVGFIEWGRYGHFKVREMVE